MPEACGLRLGESTVRAVTQDARGRTCAYVSLGLTGVPQQAKGGGPAEGRMPYVAAAYNPAPERAAQTEAEPLPVPGYEPVAETAAKAAALPEPAEAHPPQRPRVQARYVAGLMSLAALGLLLRKEAAQVGTEAAQQWIGLSDGGGGLEDFLRTNFNRANLVIILDFWHPTGYLEALARSMHPDDEQRRAEQTKAWCSVMKHEGGKAILKTLEELEIPRHRKAARQARAEAEQYVRNNVHRMDYPYYLSQGWQIGSGPIESACKTVVGQRLKLAGMRWREYGTDNVCHLRALFKSEKHQWDAFWERNVN